MILEDFLSLFYWILFSYKRKKRTLLENIQMFQSLFYWILFSYLLIMLSLWILIIRFNPYSTGFSSFMKLREKMFKEEQTFQSLFYWILFSYQLYPLYLQNFYNVSILILLDSILLLYICCTLKTLKRSFNPYSIGFYSLIAYETQERLNNL